MNIFNLSQVFKFDYTNFIKSQLNETNYFDVYPIVVEILQSSAQQKHQPEDYDKILDITLRKMFQVDADQEKLLIKYMSLSVQHCSSCMRDQLIEVFLFYFNRIIHTNETNPTCLKNGHDENYFKIDLVNLSSSNCASFLNSYLNYLTFSHLNDGSSQIVRLVYISLHLLEESDENDQIVLNLGVNVLSKLAASNTGRL